MRASTAGGADVHGKQQGGPLYDTARQLKFQGLCIEPVVTTPAASRHSRLVVGAGGEGLASSRIHQQLDLCGPFGLPAGHRETDGDALSSAAPMRVSLVSPRFLPQLGGVEAVVGYLAEELCGHGHKVTAYAQVMRQLGAAGKRARTGATAAQ